MALEPDFTAFARNYDAGRPQALHARLIADLETPVSAFLKLGEGRDNASWARLDDANVDARLDLGLVGRPGPGEAPECAPESFDTMGEIEDLEGSGSPESPFGNDVLYGDGGNNQLLGHAGADTYRALGGDDSSGGPDGGLAANVLSPSGQAMEHEQDQALREALGRLPEDYRRVITLRHEEQLSFEEIGRLLQRSPDAARTTSGSTRSCRRSAETRRSSVRYV